MIALFAGLLQAQEINKKSAVEHENQVKIGFSNQIDLIFFGYYDEYYYDDYYPHSDGGLNFHVFLAYEHLWQFPKRIAFGLEPKIGASIRNGWSSGFVGLNTKFYWANTDIWRMGILLYGGYSYANREISVEVPMDGGNYYQRKDLTMHFNSYSFDIGLIPFQFRLKNVPLTIEAVFALGGLTFFNGRSETYNDIYGPNNRVIDNYAFPYIFKGEFKLGFVIPSGKDK